LKERLKLELGGALEAQAQWSRNFAKVSGSSFTLNTAEFDFEAKVLDWATGELSAEWDSGADKITLNEGFITLGDTRRFPLYLKLGRGTLPFGVTTGATVAARIEDQLTLTDPLTKEVFEAKEDYALLGVRANGFEGGAYVYNGTTNRRGPAGEKHLEHYGATVGYTWVNQNLFVTGTMSLMDSVFDSDGLTEQFPEAVNARYAPAVAAVLRFRLGGFSLVTEYNAAIYDVPFQRLVTVVLPDGTEEQVVQVIRKRPTAWQIEAGYTTQVFGKKTYGAFGYSRTYQLAGAFPKQRLLTTVGTWLAPNMRLALEYGHEYDYSSAKGGTGRSTDSFISRLTYEW